MTRKKFIILLKLQKMKILYIVYVFLIEN